MNGEVSLSVDSVLEVVRRRLEGSSDPLLVFWCPTSEERDAFCERIREGRGDSSIIPLVVRTAAFDNPNAVLADLVKLVSDSRAAFDWLNSADAPESPIAILLVSRHQLSVPQVSSPATMPTWFPRVGGRTVMVRIEDLTWVADAPLSSVYVDREGLSEALYEIERILIGRLERAFAIDKRSGDAFWADVRRESEKYDSFLDAVRQAHRGVLNPRALRPGGMNTLLGRLVFLVNKSSPDQLLGSSKSLRRALAIGETASLGDTPSIIGVVFRSTSQAIGGADRFLRGMLVSIFAASQLITAAAHADQYPRFPVILLQGISGNLKAALQGILVAVRNLPI